MNTPLWSALVTAHWPELSARLGPRLEDFVGAARQKAALHRLQLDAAVARYVNLCFALGPNFEDKADNEWALALLSNEALGDWARLHQLVLRACKELQRLPGDGARAAAQLQRADAAFMDAHDALPRAQDASPLARVACDVDVLDIALLEQDWRREYTLAQGQWSRTPVTPLANAWRIKAGEPLPKQLSVLSHAPGSGPLARVQVRQQMHACCNQDLHPRLTLTGPHGLSRWQGYPARALSWEAHAHAGVAAPTALSPLLLEETQASISLLNAQCCGLRDSGVATGAMETWLWCYPADQYLFAFQRSAQLQAQWPRGGEALEAAEASVCTYERDGLALPTKAWAQGLDQDLGQQLQQGLERLFAQWAAVTENASMRASVALLNGQGALTWGWRESPSGMAEPAWLRVAAQFDLNQHIDLELSGELTLGLTRTRIGLSLKGALPLARSLNRDAPHKDLMETLLALGERWQIGFQIGFDPIAVDDGAMVSSLSACTGHLSAEWGLRPRPQGGGGWQFFMRMHTTPVTVALVQHDPVLGQSRKTLALLPASPLLDWSLG